MANDIPGLSEEDTVNSIEGDKVEGIDLTPEEEEALVVFASTEDIEVQSTAVEPPAADTTGAEAPAEPAAPEPAAPEPAEPAESEPTNPYLENMGKHFEGNIQTRQAASVLVAAIREGNVTLEEANDYISGLTGTEKAVFEDMLSPLVSAKEYDENIRDATSLGGILDKMEEMAENSDLPDYISGSIRAIVEGKRLAIADDITLSTNERASKDAEILLKQEQINAESRKRFMLLVRTYGPALGYGLLAAGAGGGLGFMLGGSGLWAGLGGVAAGLGVGVGVGYYRNRVGGLGVKNAEINLSRAKINEDIQRLNIEFSKRQVEANVNVIEGIRGMSETIVQLLASRYPKPLDMNEKDWKEVIRQQIASANTPDLVKALGALNFTSSKTK